MPKPTNHAATNTEIKHKAVMPQNLKKIDATSINLININGIIAANIAVTIKRTVTCDKNFPTGKFIAHFNSSKRAKNPNIEIMIEITNVE